MFWDIRKLFPRRMSLQYGPLVSPRRRPATARSPSFDGRRRCVAASWVIRSDQAASESHYLAECAICCLYGELPSATQLKSSRLWSPTITMIHSKMINFFRGTSPFDCAPQWRSWSAVVGRDVCLLFMTAPNIKRRAPSGKWRRIV